jgi:methylmalonyl-CoA mutase cobalamin-binding domain/chain
MSALEDLYEAILDGQRFAVAGLVQRALDAGVAPTAIVEETLRPAMGEVGDLFSRGEFFLPQLLLAASAMKIATETLRPLLVGAAGARRQEAVVIGTVQGDVHDIGKNLVVATLEGAGYRVVDIGVDASPSKYVEAVRANDPAVVGFSALLSTTMVYIPMTIKALEEAGLRAGRVLAVGGAPVTQRNADEWGVEAYAADAGTAVRVIEQALARRRAAREEASV